MKLVPFESSSALPAYLTADTSYLDINKDVIRASAFPVMSIKGKTFTMVRDGVKQVITKPDDADEIAQSIGVVFLRVNKNAKTYYAKAYDPETDSAGIRPTCYSYDGVAPSAHAMEPQAAKCALCKWNEKGSKVNDNGKAVKACQSNTRAAISTPDKLDPMLLRVPPKSMIALNEVLKVIAGRKVPYNSVVIKVGFDREESSPVLTFKPVGFLEDSEYMDVKEAYDGELVRSIVGLDDFGMGPVAETKKPAVDTDELDAALAAREVTRKAAEKPKALPKPVVADDLDDVVAPPKKAKPVIDLDDDDEPAPPPKKAAPKAEPAPEPKAKKGGGSDLLADLDDLLGTKDD